MKYFLKKHNFVTKITVRCYVFQISYSKFGEEIMFLQKIFHRKKKKRIKNSIYNKKPCLNTEFLNLPFFLQWNIFWRHIISSPNSLWDITYFIIYRIFNPCFLFSMKYFLKTHNFFTKLTVRYLTNITSHSEFDEEIMYLQKIFHRKKKTIFNCLL